MGCSECQIKKLGLALDEPQCIVEPAWGGRSYMYLTYRWLAAVYFLTTSVYIAAVVLDFKFLIYFSFWHYVLLLLATLAHALCVSYHVCITRDTIPGEYVYTKTPVAYKLIWISQNVNMCAALVATAVTYIFEPSEGTGRVGSLLHAANIIYMILDSCVTGIPYRLLHFYQPMIAALLYAIFSVTYWAAGGTDPYGTPDIYEYLSYDRNPGLAAGLGVVMTFVVAPGVFAIWWPLHAIKLKILRRSSGGQQSASDEEMAGNRNVQLHASVPQTTAGHHEESVSSFPTERNGRAQPSDAQIPRFNLMFHH